ncbi:hypothetical protein FH832_002821 [Listeria monocytogenes]|nr:hypothetical protein [Listeria monocytogenes]
MLRIISYIIGVLSSAMLVYSIVDLSIFNIVISTINISLYAVLNYMSE